jgi:hypothetical protein
MDRGLHPLFDQFFFTLQSLENDTFKVVSNPAFAQEYPHFDGKVITFKDKQEKWPGREFLKYHNERFEEAKKVIDMKAAAEPKDYHRQDSDTTLNHVPVPIPVKMKLDPIKLWVEEQGKIEEYSPIPESQIIPPYVE